MKHPYGTDAHLAELIESLMARVEKLEARVFPQPDADGWLTNGYGADKDTLAVITAEFGAVRIGEPKASTTKSADQLKAEGIVGFYVAKFVPRAGMDDNFGDVE
jgi:hypothetical protein